MLLTCSVFEATVKDYGHSLNKKETVHLASLSKQNFSGYKKVIYSSKATRSLACGPLSLSKISNLTFCPLFKPLNPSF